jgi:hypothetical protein
MATGWYSGLRIEQAVKRRVFVSYHHGGDQPYYDAFSRTFCDAYDVITDNSLERVIDSENVDYVMRRIREDYIAGTSCTIVLVGGDTWGRKYVDWEIKATLEKQHGLIGVRLPSAPVAAHGTVTVPARLHDNIRSGYALWLPWTQITAGVQACTAYIEQANARDKRLIDNSRERRLRNA